MPAPRLAIVQTPLPKASAADRDPKHDVVAITSGWIRHPTPEDREGVLGRALTRSVAWPWWPVPGPPTPTPGWVVQNLWWQEIGRGNA